ncbi:fimbrial protein [Entomohabitans teleogrylli]|uniref:fimbrial protein n=1 Tax=Entomohabitans teleogrylli TaxID=1384589 RepID=UPI00073DAD12|nr:fimbrial protein [Entomohabitans teleogrylli]
MKAKRYPHLIALSALLLGGMCISGKAAAVCYLYDREVTDPSQNPFQSPLTYTFPLNIQLTGAAEAAVGSTLYKGTVSTPETNMLVTCFVGSSGILGLAAKYSVDSGTTWSGDIGQYSGKIYNTGIAGVGLVVSQGSNIFPYSTTYSGFSEYTHQFSHSVNLEYAFIKTGPVSPGSVSSSQLPTFSVTFSATDNSGTTNIKWLDINFTGFLAVNAPTCNATEADKVVNLGQWPASRFAAVGNGSDWVDSSLTMICDAAFYGSGGEYGQTLAYDSINLIENGAPQVTANRGNHWGIRFSSLTGEIDASRGIIALDSSMGDNASGIGIQLSSTADDSGIADLNTGWAGAIDLGSNNFRVPVFARYIRTGNVTGGSANGKVIYTISYQ